jgi:penicillin-binding protein 1A
VGVWVGNDDNTPTRGVTGGDLPARIWNEFVTQSAAARAKAVRVQARIAGLSATTAADAKPAASAAVIRGGRATANATPELRALEQQARSTRVGIWSGRSGDDD